MITIKQIPVFLVIIIMIASCTTKIENQETIKTNKNEIDAVFPKGEKVQPKTLQDILLTLAW